MTKMLKHLEEEHCVHTSRSQHQFTSMEDFQRWKEREEETNFVHFSAQSGSLLGQNTKYVYYICQQDGSGKAHRSKSEQPRLTDRKNKKGHIKTGSICHARMLVKNCLTDDSVDVIYIRTHSHNISFTDTQHHLIPKSIQAEIKGKIALGIPLTQIRRELRDGFGNRENRETSSSGQFRAHQFIKRRALAEMNRKMNNSTRLHTADSQSTYLLISRLETENCNPVLLYKPIGKKVIIGDSGMSDLPDAENLFAVGLQTKEQLKMMDGREIVCIDATHGTNQYGYSLLNLLVPDEFGRGYPVGHLISSCQDETTLTFFFKEIQKRSPDLKVTVMMTDDDYAAPNAVKAVFGPNVIHLLCKWHVKRAWK